ncbi:ABC transporter permease [Actinomyces dentalis]|uniref:ABC transporter permease n=1 Tax=Actinomyces dentalis TaxID=272548 RepID=UPI00042A3C8E|nr:FtsX-like permease family protein [Actinomyces dentalis]
MTTTPAAPRRRITNRRMFVIMLGRALARRRSRALAAIGSSAVGAATLFCLAAVCLAIPAQMNAQMRQFGANLILVPLQGDSGAATAGPAATPSAASAAPHPSGVATPSGSAAATPSGGSAAASATATPTAAAATAAPHPSAAASPSPGADAAAPATARVSPQAAADAADAVAAATGSSATRSAAYRYETVRINKSPYLVGGIDVDAVRALNGHWEIEGRWPGDGEVLIGLDVAESTGFKVGSTVNAEYLGSDDLSLSSTVSSSGDTAQAAGQASWRVSGIVDTGGSEDDILYVPLGQLETLTGNADAGYDVVEFSVDTTSVTAADVADAVNRAADAAGQGVRAEPVSKITSGDTRIITMLDTLFWVVAVVVLGLTLVGVSTTMTVIVSERRNEIGLRKALGASSRSIAVEFYTEAACLGLIGGLIGTAIGYALARAVGIGVFEQPIGFSWWLALLSVLLSALVAVIASAGPVQGATRIDPALVLREE